MLILLGKLQNDLSSWAWINLISHYTVTKTQLSSITFILDMKGCGEKYHTLMRHMVMCR